MKISASSQQHRISLGTCLSYGTRIALTLQFVLGLSVLIVFLGIAY